MLSASFYEGNKEPEIRKPAFQRATGTLPNSSDDVLCLTGCFIFRWQVAIEKFTAVDRDTETIKNER